MEDQFGAYWHRDVSRESDLWFKMIFCVQFDSLRNKIEAFEADPLPHGEEIDRLYARAQKYAKLRYLYKKSRIAARRVKMRISR